MEQHKRIRKIAHDAVINHLKENGWGAAGRLAKELGISPTIISEIKDSPLRETKMDTCAKIIDHLRDEIDPVVLALIETAENNSSPINIAQRSIFKKFENQELAKSINEKLLQLEQSDPELLRRASDVIDGMLAAVAPRKTGTHDHPG